MPTSSAAKFFLHAPNVHQGGGKSLLLGCLRAVPEDQSAIVQVDSRLPEADCGRDNIAVRFIPPTLKKRFRAEQWLRGQAVSGATILCFGNLPPLFPSPAKVMVFIQNRYLIDDVSLADFPAKIRWRLGVERLWLRRCAGHVDEFIVQTPSMRQVLVDSGLLAGQVVHVWPFIATPGMCPRVLPPASGPQTAKKYDFIYPASGEPHKNHRCLLTAWSLLAEEGLFPSLALTLDERLFPELAAWIAQQKQNSNLRLENLGILGHNDLLSCYRQSKALVYPSLFESFGLPLIEARQAGLPVVAAELDYVRDILDPEESFAPESARSIARAIKRFLGKSEADLSLCDAGEFMRAVLTGNK